MKDNWNESATLQITQIRIKYRRLTCQSEGTRIDWLLQKGFRVLGEANRLNQKRKEPKFKCLPKLL
jgi:hypothetical protein